MTAIYAYAHEQVAFVAGDTCRVDRNRQGRSVCKVHHWSDAVVLAQAGEAQFLTQLIGVVRPLMGFYPPTDEAFFDAFSELHRKFWSDAEMEYASKGISPVPDGTVLVAAAATPTHPARIHKVDFKTGARVLCVGTVDADGTDEAQFKADALRNFLSLQSTQSDSRVPLDPWACLCASDAVNAHTGVISYPVDALIARPSGVGDRLLVQRRIQSSSSPPVDLFAVATEELGAGVSR